MRSLKTYVPIDKWSDVMDRADKAGLSVSKYLTALIDRDELDAEGRPAWAASPLHSPESGVLPGLETSAA